MILAIVNKSASIARNDGSSTAGQKAWARRVFVDRDRVRDEVLTAVIVENRVASAQQIIDAAQATYDTQVSGIVDKFIQKGVW